jgi:hypothetical protein
MPFDSRRDALPYPCSDTVNLQAVPSRWRLSWLVDVGGDMESSH